EAGRFHVDAIDSVSSDVYWHIEQNGKVVLSARRLYDMRAWSDTSLELPAGDYELVFRGPFGQNRTYGFSLVDLDRVAPPALSETPVVQNLEKGQSVLFRFAASKGQALY